MVAPNRVRTSFPTIATIGTISNNSAFVPSGQFGFDTASNGQRHGSVVDHQYPLNPVRISRPLPDNPRGNVQKSVLPSTEDQPNTMTQYRQPMDAAMIMDSAGDMFG